MWTGDFKVSGLKKKKQKKQQMTIAFVFLTFKHVANGVIYLVESNRELKS